MTCLDQLRARVAASRAAQGFPPVITDPATLDRAADILRTMDPGPAPADRPGRQAQHAEVAPDAT